MKTWKKKKNALSIDYLNNINIKINNWPGQNEKLTITKQIYSSTVF